MIEELKVLPKYKKIIILSSLVVSLLVLLCAIFQPNTTEGITRQIKRILSLEGNEQVEVKSIEMSSDDYDGEGSWKLTKSAKWLDKDKAQIDIEVESVLKRSDAKYKDIIFVLDVSGSMTGSKIEQVKSDSIDLITYLMSEQEPGSEDGSQAALITFSDHSTIKQGLTNNLETLTQKINEIEVSGNTNYNEPLQQVDEIMQDYVPKPDHDAIVFFLTDGLPNVDTPNQIGTYRMLKEKYPFLIISGVQYEMGREILDEIKQISDEQYSTDMKTLRTAMYEIATRPLKYNKFYVEDIINNDYFEVTTSADITSDLGETSLQVDDNKQKVIWSMDRMYATGEKAKLTIKVKLKDGFINNYGFYPTNNSTKVIYKLQESSDITKYTTNTPVLTNKYTVIYDPNTPEGCDLSSYSSIENYYIYTRVDQRTDELTCDGYIFDGYKTDENDEKDIIRINDNTFLMPAHNVTIRGTWSKVSIKKSMEGTIHEKKTLYKVLEDEAKIGTYARTYIGEHQDNFENEPTSPVIKNLELSDYEVIRNNSSYPYVYNEETQKWEITNHDGNYTSDITFRIKSSSLIENNNIQLEYNGISSNYGYIYIYINGNMIDNSQYIWSSEYNHQTYDISNIDSDSEIRVKYDGYLSEGSYLSFNISYADREDIQIYHWYANYSSQGDANSNTIKNKNNVIFANHCWQMVRTTDTGGVKMIYNGEVQDGKCLNTRGNHVGYSGADQYGTFESSYWYGTDYIYDSATDSFKISGTVTSGETKTREYTCKSSSPDAMCSTLYYVEGYNYGNYYYYLKINSNSHYSQYGESKFNYISNTLASIGYMNNINYPSKTYGYSYEHPYYHTNLGVNYYYSDEIEYINGEYVLINPQKIETTDDYPNTVGKYIILSDSKTKNSYVYYVCYLNSSTIYHIYLSNGKMLDDLNDTYTYGDTYIDNEDGTYTINNATSIKRIDYYKNRLDLKNKYLCINDNNDTCSDLRYISHTDYDYFCYDRISETNYKYSNSFEYRIDPEDNQYKYFLNDNESVTFWETSNSNKEQLISNAHYTCRNITGKCNTLDYVYREQGYYYYIELTNGKSVEDAINEMLYNDSVNANNSSIKGLVDEWYKKYIYEYNYDEYIEDIIYCDDRSIRNLGGWNPNGGSLNSDILFGDSSGLTCNYITDKFSTLNNKAKLTYKVGLISKNEVELMYHRDVSATGKTYWLMSPVDLGSNNQGHVINVYASSGTTNGSVNYSYGVRPAISLKPGMEYTEGDGSMEHPYYIETEVDTNG